MHNQNWGKFGEDMAAKFLERQGFQIVERNFRTRWGEIDLIVQKGEHLHFVEVKTRLIPDYGRPEEAVHRFKKQRLLATAKMYVAWRAPTQPYYQIDIVSILLNMTTRRAKIKYFENVVLEK